MDARPERSVASRPSETGYRWYVLGLATLTSTFTVAMPGMCLSVLFDEIASDLGLNLVQIGLIWGIGALAGMPAGLVGGALGDRYGTRRTLSVACLLVGLTGALRGMSSNLVTLELTVLLFGLTTPLVMMNLIKTCGVWFSQRQLGLANGAVAMGMASGFTVSSMISATILSPWLGGWRNVLFLYGAIALITSVLWYLSRPVPSGVETSDGETGAMTLRQTVSHVARLPRVWLLGFALMGVGGCVQGTLGYLPLYLRGRGWPVASADGALAAFHAASMVCVIPIASWSDRLGSRKTVLLGAAMMTVVGVGLLSVVDGIMVWAAVVMAGLVRDGFMAVFTTAVLETKGVGVRFGGTAMGLVMLFSGLARLVAPPLGNSLAEIGSAMPFVFWATLAVVGLLGLFFVREDRALVAA